MRYYSPRRTTRLLRALCSAFYAFQRRDRYPHGIRSGRSESCRFCRFVIGRDHSLRLSTSKLPSPFSVRQVFRPAQAPSKLVQTLFFLSKIMACQFDFIIDSPFYDNSSITTFKRNPWQRLHASTHHIQHDGLWLASCKF